MTRFIAKAMPIYDINPDAIPYVQKFSQYVNFLEFVDTKATLKSNWWKFVSLRVV